MNRFVKEVLPKGLEIAKAEEVALSRHLMELTNSLAYDYEYTGHNCNCEFCQYNTDDYEPLTTVERKELKKEIKKVSNELAELRNDIKSMVDYQAFIERIERLHS